MESDKIMTEVAQKAQQIIEGAEERANSVLESRGEKMEHQLLQTEEGK